MFISGGNCQSWQQLDDWQCGWRNVTCFIIWCDGTCSHPAVSIRLLHGFGGTIRSFSHALYICVVLKGKTRTAPGSFRDSGKCCSWCQRPGTLIVAIIISGILILEKRRNLIQEFTSRILKPTHGSLQASLLFIKFSGADWLMYSLVVFTASS